MKKKDRIVVAVIVVLALVVGLVMVYRGLSVAERGREELIHSIWSERSEMTQDSAGDENDAGDTAEGDGAAGEAEGLSPDGQEDLSGDGGGLSGDDLMGDGEDFTGDDPFGAEDGFGGDDPFGEDDDFFGDDSFGDGDSFADDDPFGEGAGEDGSSSGGDVGQTEDPFGDSEGGDPGVMPDGGGGSTDAPLIQPDYGDPPVLGATALSTEELVEWMTTSSAGAQEAQNSLERENAVAAGQGSENDPDRRAFAQTQSGPNYTARLNLLEETAVRLAMDFLRTRDALDIAREDLTFYEGVEKVLQEEMAAKGSDPVVKEKLEKDGKKLQELLGNSKIAAEEAEVSHKAAAEALCAATGNDVSAGMTVTGELTVYADPGLTPDTAVAQAMELRNEVHSARYGIVRAQKNLTDLRFEYGPNSPEIVAQQNDLAQAQANYPATQSRIEADLRELLGKMTLSQQKQKKFQNDLSQVPDEPPAYHLEVKKVEEGEGEEKKEVTKCMSNMDELLGSWSKTTQIKLQQVNEIAQYNLWVVQAKHAADVGCTPALI